eukprot:scaffold23138_cov107-Isochrysis_galbana.AAC.2
MQQVLAAQAASRRWLRAPPRLLGSTHCTRRHPRRHQRGATRRRRWRVLETGRLSLSRWNLRRPRACTECTLPVAPPSAGGLRSWRHRPPAVAQPPTQPPALPSPLRKGCRPRGPLPGKARRPAKQHPRPGLEPLAQRRPDPPQPAARPTVEPSPVPHLEAPERTGRCRPTQSAPAAAPPWSRPRRTARAWPRREGDAPLRRRRPPRCSLRSRCRWRQRIHAARCVWKRRWVCARSPLAGGGRHLPAQTPRDPGRDRRRSNRPQPRHWTHLSTHPCTCPWTRAVGRLPPTRPPRRHQPSQARPGRPTRQRPARRSPSPPPLPRPLTVRGPQPRLPPPSCAQRRAQPRGRPRPARRRRPSRSRPAPSLPCASTTPPRRARSHP